MSKITGYLKQLETVPATDRITIRMAAWPVIQGQALIVPDQKTVTARASDGYWEITLSKGAYELSVKAANGQEAKVTIDVPDDANTYSFEQRVISSLPAATAPVGGAQPTASAGVLGLVRTDESVAVPVVPTGFFWKTDYAAVRALANLPNNKIVFVSSTDDAFDWSAISTAVDDATNVLKPDDTLVGNPGRWLKRVVSGGGGGGTANVTSVATRAALKALASSVDIKCVIITNPEEAGIGLIYVSFFGDVTAGDDFAVIQPTDGLTRYFRRF